MLFCSKCGKQLADGTRFCDGCGSPVGEAAAPAASNPNPGFNQNPNFNQAPNFNQNFNQNPNPNFNQNFNAQYSNIGRTPVKTDRSLLMYILLTIVTCGIYGYIFVYELAKDVNQMCAEDGDKVGGLGAYILLSFLTCGIYSIYWLYKIQNRLQAAGPRYGVPIAESGSSVVLWYVIGMFVCFIGMFVSMNIVINSANKVGMAYNARYFYNQRPM